MAKFCGNCGKPLGENDKVCGNCGTHVAVNEAVPPTAQSRTASNAINGKKATVIGVALLAMIVLAVVLIKVASGTTTKPSTSSTSSAPSSSAAQQIVANSRTPDVEPTPIPVAEKETIEEKAKKAINELEVWDGSVAESFDGGDGSEENPYQIANGAQLAKLAQDTNSGIDFDGKFFVLTSDIMLNDISKWNFEKSVKENTFDDGITSSDGDTVWIPIGEVDYTYDNQGGITKINEKPFSGLFDGADHTVWGLCTRGVAGLFGYIKGHIEGVNVACGNIGALGDKAGSIVAWMKETSITDCHAEQMYIQSDNNGFIGGICGAFEGNCTVYDCSAKSVIIEVKDSLRTNVGGICGSLFGEQTNQQRLNVFNCYSECEIAIRSAVNGMAYHIAGGICGVASNVSNCVSNTDIVFENVENNSNNSIDYLAGGIAGMCTGDISYCESNGNIAGACNSDDYYVSFAGIAATVGRGDGLDTYDIHIDNCLASGEIRLDDSDKFQNGKINGLFCNIYSDEEIDASITNSYYVSPSSIEAFGNISEEIVLFSDQVKRLSNKKEVCDPSNFANWDFENIWIIDKKINGGLPIPRSLLELITKKGIEIMAEDRTNNAYQKFISEFSKQKNGQTDYTNSKASNSADNPSPIPKVTEAPSKAPSNTSSASSDTEPLPTSKKSSNGRYATVKDFLSDPDTKAQLDATIKQMVSDGDSMNVSLDGTGDTMIYRFIFTDDAIANADEEALKITLADSLSEESFVSTFEGIAASLGDVVEVDNIKVKVIYAKSDGTELASREYSSAK